MPITRSKLFKCYSQNEACKWLGHVILIIKLVYYATEAVNWARQRGHDLPKAFLNFINITSNDVFIYNEEINKN